MIRLGGATSTAPRIATNFRPVLRHDLKPRSLTTTFAPLASTTSTRSYIPVFEKKDFYVRKEVSGRIAPYTTMASATSFFDFKPKDSTSLTSALSLSHPSPISYLPATATNSTIRKGRPLRPRQAQWQSRPRRKHSLEMRLHPPIRGPREALQGRQGQIPKRL